MEYTSIIINIVTLIMCCIGFRFYNITDYSALSKKMNIFGVIVIIAIMWSFWLSIASLVNKLIY